MTNQQRTATGRRMAAGHAEAGFLTFSGVMLILTLAAIWFLSYKLLPPYVRNYELQDTISGLARTASYNQSNESELRSEIMREARDIGIDLEERELSVSKVGTAVDISIHYERDIDLLVHTLKLEFSPVAGNRNIMAK